jgi:hypothetical protein
MNVTARFWTRLLPALLLAGSLTIIGSVTYASPPTEDEASFTRVDPALTEHLRTEVRARDWDRQEKALVDIVALASCQAACSVQLQSMPGKTVRGSGDMSADLLGLGPDLLQAYRTSPSDEHRLLVLSALMNVGDEASLDALIENPGLVSNKQARTTRRHVTSFYLERYPELRYQVRRTGILSLDNVKIARDRHERIQRREARRG